MLEHDFELLGVVIDGPPPIGRLSFRFTDGLTVIYGRNGVGKSRLLAAIRAALDGVKMPDGRSWLVFRCPNPTVDFEGPENAHPVSQLLDHLNGQAQLDDRIFTYTYNLYKVLHFVVSMNLRTDIYGDTFSDPRDEPLIKEVASQAIFLAEANGTATDPSWHLFVGAREDEGFPVISSQFQAFRRYSTLTDRIACREATRDDYESLIQLPVGDMLHPCDDTWRLDTEPWVPLPLLSLGERWTPPAWVRPDIDATHSSMSARTTALLREGLNTLTVVEDNGSTRVRPEVRNTLDTLERNANRHYEVLLLDAPTLVCEVQPIESWLNGDVVRWVALDPESAEDIALDGLSTAQRRWALLAIDYSLRYYFVDDPAYEFERFMLLDEPESALHTVAQQHLTGGLVAESERVGIIAATHSAAILSATGARLLHMGRGRDGTVSIDELPATVSDPAHAADFGMSPAELLQLTRAWIVVEGTHDKTVIETLIGAKLKPLSVRILIMAGHKHADIINSEFIFDYTDSSVLVVLDRTRGDRAQASWNHAVERSRQGDTAAFKNVDWLNDGSTEERWLYGFCRKALDAGRYRRVGIYGLTLPDIIEYLPVKEFVPHAVSWDSLVQEWKRAGQPGQFKPYLHDKHHAIISKRTIEKACRSLDELPDDIVGIATAVADLLGRKNEL